MNLNVMLENNYPYLQEVALRITGGRLSKSQELISETCLEMYGKADKAMPLENEAFIKWFCKGMKNSFIWRNSGYGKIHKPRECLREDFESYLSVDEDSLKEIEFEAEGVNDATRELMEMSTTIGKDRAMLYVEVLDFKRSLLEYEKILFELHFEKELSSRKIAEMYSDGTHKMNYQSVNTMINVIKKKIKRHKWKQ